MVQYFKGHANNLLANAKGPRNKNKSSSWSNISRATQENLLAIAITSKKKEKEKEKKVRKIYINLISDHPNGSSSLGADKSQLFGL